MKTREEKEALLEVYASVLRPLMPAAFEYGLTAGEIASVARRVYIQELEARLKEQQRPTTDARLAIVAGLPKSDVSALRDTLRTGALHSQRTTATSHQLAQLLTVWHTDNRFSAVYGTALDLDLTSTQGSPRRSFPELAAAACPGIEEESMLDELVAAGSVELIDGQTVRCLSRAYVPGASLTRITRMGRYLGVVIKNFVHNLLRAESEPAYFERAVVSDERLSSSGRDKFLSLAAERGQELLSELDTFLEGLGPDDRSEAGIHFGVGVYFFAEDNIERSEHAQPDVNSKKMPAGVEEIDVLATRHKYKKD